MSAIENLLRKNIRSLVPYSSARDEYQGDDAVLLDANENPYKSAINRYPDPHQKVLKNKIAEIKNIPASAIFLGNGSDEAIDLLIRAFCEPGIDNIVSMKPSYGMYQVCAAVNNVEFREVLLKKDFQLDVDAMLGKTDERTKIIFLCSPNNPTSNLLKREDIILLIRQFKGLVVLDEAYIDFSDSPSLLSEFGNFSNLVILQTFSKAWGMAGIRLGLALADSEIIRVLSHIKYPYNINILTQQTALDRLKEVAQKDEWISAIRSQREFLKQELSKLNLVKEILPSDSNFLMVKFDHPHEVFTYLTNRKIIVRDRSRVALCEGFLRITIGTEEETRNVIQALKEY
jgi:histidinol-phosphate aminotransferase